MHKLFPYACIASCAKFLIDIGLEIVILYEDVYEIFGDIHAAHNSFGIEAYEQGNSLLCCTTMSVTISLHPLPSFPTAHHLPGGICIGRVTYACLSLPN